VRLVSDRESMEPVLVEIRLGARAHPWLQCAQFGSRVVHTIRANIRVFARTLAETSVRCIL